ncbi:MAG: HAMP domain-containing histidine kinase [Acidobacteriota bacterium]|nr:HAMP domain-containing histidine kinase [Acidobacteriota bacterium]
MNNDPNKRSAYLSWLFMGALAILTAVLGVLQYGWIDEVSRAEKERLQAALHTSLLRLSRDFNNELTAAASALIPIDLAPDEPARERQFAARYEQWKDSSRQNRLFRGISLAIPDENSLRLRTLNLDTGVFEAALWPATWISVKGRLSARLLPGERRPFIAAADDQPDLIDIPIFNRGKGDLPFSRETAWLILQVDLDTVRNTIIPDLLQRDLAGGTADYQAAVVMRDNPSAVIYHSGPEAAGAIGPNPDSSVRLFEVDRGQIFRGIAGRGGYGEMRGGWRGRSRNGGPPPQLVNANRGRWELLVRHRAGSVEAVVSRARARNLAAMAGILVLILVTVAALIRFTRRAQKLAELQMEFVAGVSHELRTPLTVMRTAGHNLQGKISSDPARVQRYGALIQEESQKLTSIVDQVLRFANAKVGRVIGERQSLQVSDLIEDALELPSGCVIEKHIASNLPAISGDPTTLKVALQNLLSNAAKYGTGDWIGISASVEPGRKEPMVEIGIADRGAGIPPGEIGRIFDPFYRGERAMADQVHGTGLGLSLTKRILEAHGGTLAVRSEAGKGTEFLMRIPAAPVEQTHEFANSAD